MIGRHHSPQNSKGKAVSISREHDPSRAKIKWELAHPGYAQIQRRYQHVEGISTHNACSDCARSALRAPRQARRLHSSQDNEIALRTSRVNVSRHAVTPRKVVRVQGTRRDGYNMRVSALQIARFHPRSHKRRDPVRDRIVNILAHRRLNGSTIAVRVRVDCHVELSLLISGRRSEILGFLVVGLNCRPRPVECCGRAIGECRSIV